MANSRQKGKRGELELARVLRENGIEARRGVQYSGANGDADVVGMEGIHIECKRNETLNIDNALDQAINDARTDEVPVVMHRKNKKPWKVTMLLTDWIELYKTWSEGR